MSKTSRIALHIKIDLPNIADSTTVTVDGMLEFLETFFQSRFGLFNPTIALGPEDMAWTSGGGVQRVCYYLEVNCDTKIRFMRDRYRVRGIIGETLSNEFKNLNPIVMHAPMAAKDDI